MKNKARLHIVQAIYQREIAHSALADLLADYPTQQKALADSKTFQHFEAILRYACDHQTELDQIISAHLPPDWTLARLEKVLLAILRAGAAEARHLSSNMSDMVADYVEIAHRLLDRKPAAMANAILDHIARPHGSKMRHDDG